MGRLALLPLPPQPIRTIRIELILVATQESFVWYPDEEDDEADEEDEDDDEGKKIRFIMPCGIHTILNGWAYCMGIHHRIDINFKMPTDVFLGNYRSDSARDGWKLRSLVDILVDGPI